MKKKIFFISMSLLLLVGGIWVVKNLNLNRKHQVGDIIDSFNNVAVYYNGGVDHVEGRNTTIDGYNLGLKYQCVEFIKRYYYEYYQHKMPDSYGHAKDFFNSSLKDNQYNQPRDLYQFTNSSEFKPEIGDIIVFEGSITNRFGHVAIISRVDDKQIEIIQQNAGTFSSSRDKISLSYNQEKWKLENTRIKGWLRKK